MKRAWTTKGAEYNASDEQRIVLGRVFAGLAWEAPPKFIETRAHQTTASAIRSLRIPHVSLVAHSGSFDGRPVYGIEGHFSNGRARVYLLDRGCGTAVVLATDFWPLN